MERTQEQRLIKRAARGDRSAIEALVRAHQGSLYAFVVRLTGRPEVAEDVVQEAFVRVLGNIDRFDLRFRFSTWVFTIARRLYLNAAQKLTPGFDTEAVERRTSGAERPELRLSGQDQARSDRDLLDGALEILSAEQREVVLLFHQHDWPIRTIAEHMQMPEGTVKSHLHRARRTLRAAMAPMMWERDGATAVGDAASAGGGGSGSGGGGGGVGLSEKRREMSAREQRQAPVLRLAQTEVRL